MGIILTRNVLLEKIGNKFLYKVHLKEISRIRGKLTLTGKYFCTSDVLRLSNKDYIIIDGVIKRRATVFDIKRRQYLKTDYGLFE